MRPNLRPLLSLQALLVALGCGRGHRAPVTPPPDPPAQPTHLVYEASWGVLAVPLTGGTPVTLGLTTFPCRYAGVSGNRGLFFSYDPWRTRTSGASASTAPAGWPSPPGR